MLFVLILLHEVLILIQLLMLFPVDSRMIWNIMYIEQEEQEEQEKKAHVLLYIMKKMMRLFVL